MSDEKEKASSVIRAAVFWPLRSLLLLAETWRKAMGEIAEMMMEGGLCESCGVYLETNGIEGFPQLCGQCAADVLKAGGTVREVGNGNWQNTTPINQAQRWNPHKAKCPTCGRKVKAAGLKDHIRDVHKAADAATANTAALTPTALINPVAAPVTPDTEEGK